MATCSKAFQTFSNRLLHFDADIELMDIIDASVKAGFFKVDEAKLFEKLDPAKHPVLANRTPSHNNQVLAKNHLRQTVYSSYIKDVYEEVYSYLQAVLSEAAVNAKIDPKRFVGDQSLTITVTELLSADKLQTIVEKTVAKIFRNLESERSTKALIEKTCGKLNIKVRKKTIDDAVYYLEIRHQLVHADGKADEAFKASHGNLSYTDDNYIDLRYKLIKQFRDTVYAFVSEFDSQAIKMSLIQSYTANSDD